MDRFIIKGPTKLEGNIDISGSKNAALPIMAACLGKPGIFKLSNVPNLRDTRTMVKLLEIIGCKIESKNKRDEIDTRNTAEQTIYQTESQLKELDDKLSNEHKKNLNAKKDELQGLVKDGSVETIKEKMEDLNKVWAEIYQSMQSNPQNGDSEKSNDQASSQQNDNNNVEDADFEVVDEK